MVAYKYIDKMCFGNKKKKPTAGGGSTMKRSNSSRSRSGKKLRKSDISLGKELSKSIVKDETILLGKSSVKIKEIIDPVDVQLFPNCRT